jgi:hypothetical protein
MGSKMEPEEEELEHGHIDPAKEFVLALCAGPHDGDCGVNWDGNIGFPDEKTAVEWTRDSVDCDGGEYMLYRCTPIKRVTRGPTRVAAYKPKRR